MVMLLFSLISLLTNLFSSSSFIVTIVAERAVEGKQTLSQLALRQLGKIEGRRRRGDRGRDGWMASLVQRTRV